MKQCVLYCLLLTVLASCSQMAIYQSPVHTNSSTYKTIPLQNEGIASASYAGLHISAGNANHRGHDYTLNLSGTYHRSHNFEGFQATYGANFMLGNYRVRRFSPDSSTSRYDGLGFDPAFINDHTGNKFFGAWGINGSFNAVMKTDIGEWRILGTELSYTNEFGNYLNFRRKLPVYYANSVDPHNQYFTYGFFTELVNTVGDGNTMGFKLAWTNAATKVTTLERDGSGRPYHEFTPRFLSATAQVTLHKMTMYGQANFGSYASSLQGGVLLRLGSTKKAGKAAGL
ncbi:hypothetical protein [Paraflavitalea sp. CAU 1676]|uniref:hypothetical protein n=1 Tax=Paraflavitalea sp. CAU 1676 TaxID=3032598 RepID=UPI0023DAC342|nr:hypothetical protein [Paraflavitalea sp. CAU 1676]MDF2191899.1 hypothetical protein [Paraflavitalea sp. CAU 1676]